MRKMSHLLDLSYRKDKYKNSNDNILKQSNIETYDYRCFSPLNENCNLFS